MTLLKLLKWSVTYIKKDTLSLHCFSFSFLFLDLVLSLRLRNSES